MSEITLWEFVTGDWAGHAFTPLQFLVIGLAGLEILIALALWGMAILRVLGVTWPKSLNEGTLKTAKPPARATVRNSPPPKGEYSIQLAALTPQSGVRVTH